MVHKDFMNLIIEAHLAQDWAEVAQLKTLTLTTMPRATQDAARRPCAFMRTDETADSGDSYATTD